MINNNDYFIISLSTLHTTINYYLIIFINNHIILFTNERVVYKGNIISLP